MGRQLEICGVEKEVKNCAIFRKLQKKICERFGLENVGDSRGCRFVAVIECILNQNARDAGAARSPAINLPILELCNKYDVGILQIPCPEIRFLGFARKRQKGKSIRDALDTPEGRRCCREISIEIADRIQVYIAQGYQLLSVLAGNPESPGCAVHYNGDKLSSISGILMKELFDELNNRHIDVPFKGIRDFNSKLLSEDIEWVRTTFTRNVT